MLSAALALYDTTIEMAHRVGYAPLPLYARVTLRADLAALVLALALGFENPAEVADLGSYGWGMLLLTVLLYAGNSVLSPWMSHHVSPSVKDATVQLSVTLGLVIDILAYGKQFTAFEGVGAGLVLLTVLLFYWVAGTERAPAAKQAAVPRRRASAHPWPYAARAGSAMLALAVLVPGLYGSSGLRRA